MTKETKKKKKRKKKKKKRGKKCSRKTKFGRLYIYIHRTRHTSNGEGELYDGKCSIR